VLLYKVADIIHIYLSIYSTYIQIISLYVYSLFFKLTLNLSRELENSKSHLKSKYQVGLC